MSLTQINDYGIGDVNLTSMMETLDRQRRGYQAISLTHYDDYLECEIAAGSIVEVGGALFKTEANEPITGWGAIAADTDVYIKLVVTGATAAAEFTDVIPTWSPTKQGWYVGNDRYIGGLYKEPTTDYYLHKWLYTDENTQQILREGHTRPILEKVVEIGGWDMDANAGKSVSHGITREKFRSITGMIRSDPPASEIHFNIPCGPGGSATGILQLWFYQLSSTISLVRLDGGVFDSTSYDDDTFNRGWIYIKYRA